jgi:type IV pilus secretin PilQ/predicted competence protein
MMVTGNRSLVAVATVVALCALVHPGTAAAEDSASILGMAWTPNPAPALVLSATGPLQYTEARPEPGVLILEFPQALPAEPLAPVVQPQAGLRRAELASAEAGGRQFARLRVEFDPQATAVVHALPAGIEVRLEGRAPAPVVGGGGRELTDLLAVADDSGVSVLLSANGPLEGKAFFLDNPPRVVVDLAGATNRVARRVHPVTAAGVQKVRVAQFAVAPDPVVRVVVDLDATQPYRFESTPRGAVLRVGSPAGPAVAAAVTPAEPPKVAPAEVAASPKPAPAPVVTEAAPVAAAAEPQAVVKEPVTIVDEPLAEAEAPVAAPRPAEAVPAPVSKDLLAPPASAPAPPPASPADSPWTTTPAAMAEQAQPATTVVGGTRELESQERRFTGEPLSMELKDADIKDVLRTFSKITGLNIVVDPDVTGSVTVQLENVPWDQALDIVLRINRLDYIVENNVLRVARIERLTSERQQLAEFRKQAESAKPMRTVTKILSYARAQAVRDVLKQDRFLMSDRGSVVIDERTNQLIIRDNADRLEGILALIDSLDQPTQQVVIEARIVETTRSFSRALGVQWGFTGLGDAEHGTTTGWKFPYSYGVDGQVNLAKPGNAILAMTFADILDAFSLDFALSAAESQGIAKIVSSPKVTAQNNEKAHIQAGVQIPVQTVANQTVTVLYIDATLSLDVTPQITAEGTVILDVDLKKREPIGSLNVNLGQNVPISTRDARTKVMVRDGGTTVLGGIYKMQEGDSTNGVPYLNKIPIVGWLFKNTEVTTQHDELLIFITPRIIKY